MTDDQYASSPGDMAYYYTELAISSLVVTETIASTHCDYPRRDDWAKIAWVVVYIPITQIGSPPEDNHPSQN